MANTRVALITSTMDRPEFLIRTFDYYAKMNSPHPIYLGDSSNPKNAEIIKKAIDNVRGVLEVHYNWFPPGFDNWSNILPQIKEKYAASYGDDDYAIPSSMTRCAEFLENNPDYASAGGRGITLRLKTSGPYGEIRRLADYPMNSISAETASGRLLEFMKNYYTLTFAVNKTDVFRNIKLGKIKLISTWNEISGIAHCAIAGKSKQIDCLQFVRQIHDKQYYASTMVDWLTDKDFHNSYLAFKDILAGQMMEMDQISESEAEAVIKEAFWEYLQIYMASERKDWLGRHGPSPTRAPIFKLVKSGVGKFLPILKTIYHNNFPDKDQLHYDVIDPRSPYYRDFKPVWDSFTRREET